MTYEEFLELFPGDDACLAYLKDRSYPDGTICPGCSRASKFHRIRGRSAYSCQFCGTHVYPTAGTIFEKSTTSLQLWFWAIFLMSTTHCEISARQLERELAVTYKTARRMTTQIRTMLLPGAEPAGELGARESPVDRDQEEPVPGRSRTSPPINLRRRLRLSERS